MKLPISIFPNVTEYAKANWTGYLEPRDITLTNHTNLGAGVTWEMLDKGTIHIHKPYSQTVRNALMEWKAQCPANTKVIVMFRGIDGYPGLADQAAIFSGVACTKKMDDGKTAIYVSDTNGWTLTGLTFANSAIWFTDCYISLVNGDRLDACLSGNHLKPISAGDKLGLVYWDGTKYNSPSEGYISLCTTADGKNIFVYTSPSFGNGIGIVQPGGASWQHLGDGAGTYNLSAFGLTLTQANPAETDKHLMHVI